MRAFVTPLAAFGLAVASGSSALATVLTFDFGAQNGDNIANYFPIYGDRVSTFAPGPYSYGSDGGITPNVSITYTPVLKLGGVDPTRVFGDLNNVLYRDRNGGFTTGILEITLTADPGWLVCLHRFDLAAVFNSVTGVGEDLPARSIQVLNGQNVPLYQLDYDSTVPDPGTTYVPGTQPLRHRTFDWDATPIRADRLMIRLDLTQLITIGGSKVDRIGIDNIKFSQIPTPAPGPTALFIGAIGLLAARRRR